MRGDSFTNRIETYLKKDRVARDLLQRIVRHGCSRERLILLLEAASNPHLQEQLQPLFQELRRKLFPPGRLPRTRALRALAHRLNKVAGALKLVFGDSLLAWSPDAQYFQKLSADLEKGARALRQMRVPSEAKSFSYRSFLKHIPIAMLCKELRVPQSVSFVEVEDLLYFAACAKGLERQPADRAMEMQFNRLMKRRVGRDVEVIVNILLNALPHS